MSISLSKLYGKKIISNDGRIIGDVKDVILNLDENAVSHLLLVKIEHLAKSDDVRDALFKNSVTFKRVRSISDSAIVVSSK